jgi:hypothetical protein
VVPRPAYRVVGAMLMFHLACKVGLTPEAIAASTSLPADLVLNIMKGNATLSGDSRDRESVAAGLRMPDDVRGVLGLVQSAVSRAPLKRDSATRRPASGHPAAITLPKGKPGRKRERPQDYLPAESSAALISSWLANSVTLARSSKLRRAPDSCAAISPGAAK